MHPFLGQEPGNVPFLTGPSFNFGGFKRRAPRGPLEFNDKSPLAAGCVFAFCFNEDLNPAAPVSHGFTDLHALWSRQAAPTVPPARFQPGSHEEGVALEVRPDGIEGYELWPGDFNFMAVTDFSVAVRGRYQSSPSNTSHGYILNNDAGEGALIVSGQLRVRTGGSSTRAQGSTTMTVGETYNMGWKIADQDYAVWLDGVEDGTGTTTGGGVDNVGILFGLNNFTPPGVDYLTYNGWDYALSDDAFEFLHEVPYTLVRPRVPRTVFIPFKPTVAQSVSLGQASETDSAHAIPLVAGGVSVALPQAQETDTAQAIAAAPGNVDVALPQAAEADTAQAVAAVPGNADQPVGQAVVTETALPITPVGGPTSLAIGQVVMTEQALTITPRLATVGGPTGSKLANRVTAMDQLDEAKVKKI